MSKKILFLILSSTISFSCFSNEYITIDGVEKPYSELAKDNGIFSDPELSNIQAYAKSKATLEYCDGLTDENIEFLEYMMEFMNEKITEYSKTNEQKYSDKITNELKDGLTNYYQNDTVCEEVKNVLSNLK